MHFTFPDKPCCTVFRQSVAICAIGLLQWLPGRVYAHNISFCGEQIPVNKDFVATKLMNVIRGQIPNVNMLALRRRAFKFFPLVEGELRKNGIPDDFKYLPIVESGFANLTSKVGAHGYWQLMPETARELNLIVTSTLDEREDISKSTWAACKFILQTYNFISKRCSSASWVLTAAAYNFGPGNVLKTVKRQGSDYFSMTLNDETALYVYKIIAVKELFENPELYMNGFGVNIFKEDADTRKLSAPPEAEVKVAFSEINIKLENPKAIAPEKKLVFSYVPARIIARKKIFQDGDLVSFQLDEDLQLRSTFIAKHSIIQGTGWLIDGRVLVNMGYDHDVQVFGSDDQKGVPEKEIIGDRKKVLLKVVSSTL